MVTRSSDGMAKKAPMRPMAELLHQDDLHLSLDFDEFDSEDDSDDFMDNGFTSSGEDDFENEVDASLNIPMSGSHNSASVPIAVSVQVHQSSVTGAASHSADSMALVPADASALDAYDVDSDEEKDLLKGIKDEITDLVRGEMQSELAEYDTKMKAIEAGRLPSGRGEQEEAGVDKYPDLKGMEPELRAAYIKMRKLDRILEKKEKREKEVKRERILMERRMREEIALMNQNGRVQRDIQTNTEKYLALELPPSHNQGVTVDEPPPVTPLFQTQVADEDLERKSQKSSSKDDSSSTSGSGRHSSAASVSSAGTASTTLEGKEARRRGQKKRKKDFIRRNMELAANASEIIAMTDDEKKRLQDLLTDIDALPEIPEENLDIAVEENPYQVVLHSGEGFHPSELDLRSLTAIDQRLQTLMPEEEFRSIASSSLSQTPQQRLFTRVGARSEVDFETCGEKVLMESKEEREFQAKMKDIEERLSALHNMDSPQTETPRLTEDELDLLLEDCVRSLSGLSLPPDTPGSIDSSRTLDSARAQLMQNPPRLSPEVLQRLLSEAHFPMSSHLLALQDDDSKSAQGSEGGGIILAETWKAIAEQNLSEAGADSDGHNTVQDYDSTAASTPVGQHSSFPQPSLCEPPLIHTLSHRSSACQRYSSLDSEDGRLSLPEIPSSPLINMPQGGAASDGSNNTMRYQNYRCSSRGNSSLENMIHNDLSWDSDRPFTSQSQRAEGTPLFVEDFRDFSVHTTPRPPSSSGRRSGERLGKFNVKTPNCDT